LVESFIGNAGTQQAQKESRIPEECELLLRPCEVYDEEESGNFDQSFGVGP
jgi:hypothetical protein